MHQSLLYCRWYLWYWCPCPHPSDQRISHLLLLGKYVPHLSPSTPQDQTLILVGLAFSPRSDELERSSSWSLPTLTSQSVHFSLTFQFVLRKNEVVIPLYSRVVTLDVCPRKAPPMFRDNSAHNQLGPWVQNCIVLHLSQRSFSFEKICQTITRYNWYV